MGKTKLEEINRNIYDIKNKDEYEYKIKKGLTSEIINEISKQKNALRIGEEELEAGENLD